MAGVFHFKKGIHFYHLSIATIQILSIQMTYWLMKDEEKSHQLRAEKDNVNIEIITY